MDKVQKDISWWEKILKRVANLQHECHRRQPVCVAHGRSGSRQGIQQQQKTEQEFRQGVQGRKLQQIRQGKGKKVAHRDELCEATLWHTTKRGGCCTCSCLQMCACISLSHILGLVFWKTAYGLKIACCHSARTNIYTFFFLNGLPEVYSLGPAFPVEISGSRINQRLNSKNSLP